MKLTPKSIIYPKQMSFEKQSRNCLRETKRNKLFLTKRFTVYEKSLVDLRAREKEIRIDIYAEATQEKKQEVMANLQGKIF